MEDSKGELDSLQPVARKRKAPVKKPKKDNPKNPEDPEPQNQKVPENPDQPVDPLKRVEDVHNSVVDMHRQFVKLKKDLDGRLAEHNREYLNRIEKVPSSDDIEVKVMGKVNDMLKNEFKGYDDKLEKHREYFKSKHKKMKSLLNESRDSVSQGRSGPDLHMYSNNDYDSGYKQHDKLSRPVTNFGPFRNGNFHSYNGR